MDERWRVLARVREVRARLAAIEASQLRQSEARAQAALDQAYRLQAHYEEMAARASMDAAAMHAPHDGEALFTAADAQVLLSYSVGARLKAREALVPIRRAQLVRERTRVAASEAGEKFRHTAGREEAVVSRWREELRAARRRQLEREDETLAELRSGTGSTAATDGGP